MGMFGFAKYLKQQNEGDLKKINLVLSPIFEEMLQNRYIKNTSLLSLPLLLENYTLKSQKVDPKVSALLPLGRVLVLGSTDRLLLHKLNFILNEKGISSQYVPAPSTYRNGRTKRWPIYNQELYRSKTRKGFEYTEYLLLENFVLKASDRIDFLRLIEVLLVGAPGFVQST